jgi:hypothetical protein
VLHCLAHGLKVLWLHLFAQSVLYVFDHRVYAFKCPVVLFDQHISLQNFLLGG